MSIFSIFRTNVSPNFALGDRGVRADGEEVLFFACAQLGSEHQETEDVLFFVHVTDTLLSVFASEDSFKLVSYLPESGWHENQLEI